jgi:hypothetical protein
LNGPTWKGAVILCEHAVELELTCAEGHWYAKVSWTDDCEDDQFFSDCNATLEVLSCAPPFHLRFVMDLDDGCGAECVNIPGNCCLQGIPPALTLTVVSDCAGAPSPVAMTYNAAGANGAGWYTVPATVGGHSLYWRMQCLDSGDIVLWEYCDGLGFLASQPPASCSPFDTGNVTIPDITQPCCSMSAPTIRVQE